MKGEINNFLKNYKNQGIYPFHMPGHKRIKSFINTDDFLNFDITEIYGADNLPNPTGIIGETQREMAEVYGADKTFMLVNGSSSGIIAAILSVCADGDGILIGRNSHVSAYNGLILSGAVPYYLYPEMTNFGIAGGISPEKLEDKLITNSHIKAVFITSPTYEGICSDISEIAKITHKYKKILIVDEAHGAHFNFHEAFPKTAIKAGADISIQSLHKTLPALNQCALLHVKSHRVNLDRLSQCLKMMQTTSPSYIFMAVMENCVKLVSRKALFDDYISILKEVRGELLKNETIKLVSKELVNKFGINEIDISKLVFILNCNENGDYCESFLRENYKTELEMCGINHLIALTSVADSKEGFEMLKNGINRLNSLLKFCKKEFTIKFEGFANQAVYTPRKAVYMPLREESLEKCENEVSAGYVIPYPPGIPLVAPGELITTKTIQLINGYIKNNIQVVGVVNNRIKIIN